MPTSRAEVVSPQAPRYGTELVAHLANEAPASLHDGTTLLLVEGGRVHVTITDRAVRLEASAVDEPALTRVEDAVGRRLLALADQGELAVEWWCESGALRRTAAGGASRRSRLAAREPELGVPVRLYRRGLGRLLGHRFLMLTHAGRRTGRPRWTVLQVLRWDAATRSAVVVSRAGRASDWYLDLQHAPPLRVSIGRGQFAPVARELGVDEAEQVVADYEHRTWWAGPLVRGSLSRMVGWRYYGTPAQRRRLVTQLPLIELRPDDTAGTARQTQP